MLPTTPFLILAATCFARSSPRFERRLLEHRTFGPLLRDWRARGAIPARAKVAAVLGSGLGFLMMLAARPGPVPIAAAGALILAGIAYVLTRPS